MPIAEGKPALTVGSGVDAYYRIHARIYDATRWTFLHGRRSIVKEVQKHCQPTRILEVGCGTGHNLALLADAFPQASLVGVDLSADMLAVAKRKLSKHGTRVDLREQRYDSPLHEQFDLVLCSYALTMFNPGWKEAMAHAQQDVANGGHFALVDFHTTRWPFFAKWMSVNHVRMEAHLLPELEARFQPVYSRICSGGLGLWSYLEFIGRARLD
jgi:S-adenosylmethionine-diacylgycerolhomoserine-N-methlytransferase